MKWEELVTELKGGLPLSEHIPHYRELAVVLWALQKAVHEHADGSLAEHNAVTAVYLLQEVIAQMPDEVVHTWSKYCATTYEQAERKAWRVG